MKVVLTAINAKYIHSNLAIYSLKAYAKQYDSQIELAEYTINNYVDDILMDLYQRKPDVIAFSCYIWNINMVFEVAMEIKKVLPKTPIWLGGPEVSYDAAKILKERSYIDGIMIGEGEKTFLSLMNYYVDKDVTLEEIPGLAIQSNKENNVMLTSPQALMSMDEIPFVYTDMEKFKNKIIYYETSRGCPYSCSYCLSSIDKRVRLRSTELVKKELLFFIEHEIPQVKFVDRTFNCNKKHAMEIWRFIQEHDRGITNFHFEISADILSDEEIELLNSMRPGLVQLEIGVQSTNPKTVTEIRRKMDMSKLSNIVKRIYEPRNIHQHLDLIVGLPYEDLESFKKSFNDVYALKPDQLQVGFLKVLSGSYMVEQSKVHGIVYKSYAPYEVLYTKYISYEEVLALKQITQMVEVYYNSMQFANGMKYLEHFFTDAYTLYEALADFYVRKQYHMVSHSRMNRYSILLEFFKELELGSNEEEAVFREVLIYDLYLREKLKSRPIFAKDELLKKTEIIELLERNREITSATKLYHIEKFAYDITKSIQVGTVVNGETYVFFDYDHRNPLSHDAQTNVLERG